ncbi:Allantoicase [Marinobacterium lacunae]|uniref:Probable allantoicase n=1 Tax=Marinobacterium lacunae TaxID=1232683 RepID=A0A081FTE4_9GAMM|nr:allantoicase [Marinobacterium lacunae]KEA61799.1 Allantoicase [Marinobacterium lacunae]
MDYIEAKPCEALPEFTKGALNLADPRLGAEVLASSDQFFAPAERMLSPEPARFYPDRYDDHGKWMDGWESRRKRGQGHDWCVLRLGVVGSIRGFDIDTSFFTGNYPPGAQVEGCYLPDSNPDETTQWTTLTGPVSLGPDAHHLVPCDSDESWTHLRLNIFPDGGVARLVVYGDPATVLEDGAQVNLGARESGARVLAWNDSHYGDPSKILLPNKGINMGDGWETRRRREPGNDWCLIELAAPGIIERVEVDTAFFKGNYPDKCSIQAAYMHRSTDESLITQSMFWEELLPPQALAADSVHTFSGELVMKDAVTHVRLNIFPDGGVSRLRLHGRVVR